MAERSRWPDHDWLVLPVIDFDFGLYQRPQHLARGLASDGRRVMYLRTAFGPEHRVSEPAPGVLVAQLIGPDGFNLYTNRIDAETAEDFVRQILHLLRVNAIDRFVILVQLPPWASVATRLREITGAPIIFDCLDDYAGFGDGALSHAVLAESEALLASAADLVTASSRSLYERNLRDNPRTMLVPNAGDYELFSRPATPAPELQEITHPVIGYWGAIADWLDLELLDYASRERPQYQFVLIGHTWTDGGGLARRPNVRWLPVQPYTSLPRFMACFDAAMIPFRQTGLIRHTNPVKIFEFFAGGLPVASTPVPELAPWRDLIYFGSDGESFVAALDAAVNERDQERREARAAVARANSWPHRVAVLRDAAAALLPTPPRVSLVLVTHNSLHLTRLAIQSVIRNTGRRNVELIIVDNASTDGCLEYLRLVEADVAGVRVIARDVNDSFARACNIGLAAATGEYVGILNNDIVVTHGWLDRLLWHLESDTRLAAVGPVTSFAGNVAMIPVDYLTMREMHTFAHRRRADFAYRRAALPMLALFCTIMRRSLLDEIGYLDDRFSTGMFEDDDFCERIHRAGYHVALAEDVFVHHFGKASFEMLRPAEYDAVFEANRARFEEKWGQPWAPQPHR